MVRDYIILEKTVANLQLFKNYFLEDIFTQEKNSVMLQFSLPNAIEDAFIQFNLEMNMPGIFLRSHFNKAKSNAMSFFSVAHGSKVRGIDLHPSDRILFIDLGTSKLALHVFSGAMSNIFLIDNNFNIIEAFKNRDEFIAKPYAPAFIEHEDFESFPPDSSIIDAITKSSLKLSKFYARHLINSFGCPSDALLSDLNSVESFANFSWNFRKALLNSPEVFLFRSDRGFDVSLLHDDSLNIVDSFADINRALEQQFRKQSIALGFNPLHKATDSEVNGKLKKLVNAIANLQNIKDGEDKSISYRLWADLLLASTDSKLRVGNSISLEDWSGNLVTIPLNPKLTLNENANALYARAKKWKEELNARNLRLPKLINDLNLLKNIKIEFDSIANLSDLVKFRSKYAKTFRFKMENQSNQFSNVSVFREFPLGDGYTLFVGKNAQNNDFLTMKFAKSNDIWLHARGSGGSHCVLRGQGGTSKPPRNILKAAAEIAAYYSQARNAKYTPVSWTYRKNVHKPKGANVGQVVINREEVIMAEPKLPADND